MPERTPLVVDDEAEDSGTPVPIGVRELFDSGPQLGRGGRKAIVEIIGEPDFEQPASGEVLEVAGRRCFCQVELSRKILRALPPVADIAYRHQHLALLDGVDGAVEELFDAAWIRHVCGVAAFTRLHILSAKYRCDRKQS